MMDSDICNDTAINMLNTSITYKMYQVRHKHLKDNVTSQ